jgi:hypothetical protein
MTVLENVMTGMHPEQVWRALSVNPVVRKEKNGFEPNYPDFMVFGIRLTGRRGSSYGQQRLVESPEPISNPVCYAG